MLQELTRRIGNARARSGFFFPILSIPRRRLRHTRKRWVEHASCIIPQQVIHRRPCNVSLQVCRRVDGAAQCATECVEESQVQACAGRRSATLSFPCYCPEGTALAFVVTYLSVHVSHAASAHRHGWRRVSSLSHDALPPARPGREAADSTGGKADRQEPSTSSVSFDGIPPFASVGEPDAEARMRQSGGDARDDRVGRRARAAETAPPSSSKRRRPRESAWRRRRVLLPCPRARRLLFFNPTGQLLARRSWETLTGRARP
eukprot:2260335-Pleurochrysis_carterae.AAC.3